MPHRTPAPPPRPPAGTDAVARHAQRASLLPAPGCARSPPATGPRHRAGGGATRRPLPRPRSGGALRAVDDDLLGVIGLAQPDVDDLVDAGWQVLADEVGTDRQLAMPAIDECRQA